MKVKTKKVDGILNRLHVAMPAPRDEKSRPPCIPGEHNLVKNSSQVQVTSLHSVLLVGSSTVKSTESVRQRHRYEHSIILGLAVIEQDVVAHSCELSNDLWKLS